MRLRTSSHLRLLQMLRYQYLRFSRLHMYVLVSRRRSTGCRMLARVMSTGYDMLSVRWRRFHADLRRRRRLRRRQRRYRARLRYGDRLSVAGDNRCCLRGRRRHRHSVLRGLRRGRRVFRLRQRRYQRYRDHVSFRHGRRWLLLHRRWRFITIVDHLDLFGRFRRFFVFAVVRR